ncbi:MAG: right-handed parallel beta-helix repeat-containing protein, partial [Candidatus Margulisiibacteriota bacterium]
MPLLIFALMAIMFVSGCGQSTPTTTTTTLNPRPIVNWSGKTVTSSETFSAKRIYCTGNVSIENGGSLTLDNTSLYMSCEADAQYGIFVNSGGTFLVTNESNITAVNTTTGHYAFWYKEGSSGGIYSSTIEATWTPTTENLALSSEAGMFVQCNTFEVVNSTIKNSKGNGIETYRLLSANRFLASNSSFTNNSANGLLLRNGGNITISGCTLNNNTKAGLALISNALTITVESNTINNNTNYGVQIDNSSPTFYNNTITGNQWGFYIQQNYGIPQPILGKLSLSNSGYNNISGN